jgi:hypothetical protein
VELMASLKKIKREREKKGELGSGKPYDASKWR